MKDDRLYLVDIKDRIKRVEEYTQAGREAFMQSILLQDAVTRNLEIIGEAVNRISKSLKAERSSVHWTQIIGVRNLLIHDYGRVDMNVVWRIVEHDIPPFKRAIEDMLREGQ